LFDFVYGIFLLVFGESLSPFLTVEAIFCDTGVSGFVRGRPLGCPWHEITPES